MRPTCFGSMPRRPYTGPPKQANESEKRSLIDLACTWAQAALMSERVLGSSFISLPRDVGEATSVTRS